MSEITPVAVSIPAGRQVSYFAPDGSYGDARGMVVIDTTDWSDEMWETIEETSDHQLVEVAEELAKGVSDE